MAKNQDGFDPGQEVTWEQMIAAEKARKPKADTEAKKARKPKAD